MAGEKSIFISAGEQSGDLHGSSLMHELNELQQLKFTGLGGDMMSAEGLKPIAHIKELAATGIAEVVKKYGYFKSVLKKCVNEILNNNPAAVILIDFPGFNLRLAGEIRNSYEGKIIYYISPQVWAWHEKRVYKIKNLIDKMLVVFPFETGFYARYGVEAEYVGHPLVKRIDDFLKNRTRPENVSEIKKITLLPGSRNDEVKHHLPVLLDTVNLLKNDFNIELNISRAPGVNAEYFNNIPVKFNVIESNNYSCIFESDLVMTKAGTSTMECSLIGTPFLIFYKTYPVNYFLLKPMVRIKNIGIINILTGTNTVKEFIQKDFNSKELYLESRRILTDRFYREKMTDGLKSAWDILGKGNASYNAAKLINQFALV